MKKFTPYFTFLFLLCCTAEAAAQQVSDPGNNIPVPAATPPPPVTDFPELINSAVSSNYNFVRVQTPDQPVTTLSAFDYSRQTTQYFDGLGRPLQTVKKDGQADGYDLVEHHVYDSAGREAYKYLPYAFPNASASMGFYHSYVKDNIQDFYSGSQGEEPYSKTEYDNSPLNRVVKQYAPGHSWVGSDRAKIFGYGTNKKWTYLTINPLIIYYVHGGYPRWTIGNTPGAIPEWQGDYDEGQLYMTSVTDEDGKTTKEFKDKLGRVVFKMQALVEQPALPSDYAYTCFVYDDLGRLRCVIPPRAAIPQGGSAGAYQFSFSLGQDALDGLCYQYSYDERGRLIEKKLPGKAVEYYVYDRRDRQVLYQDGNLREQGKWAFTLYDALDRPVVTGETSNNSTRDQWAAFLKLNTVVTSQTNLLYYITHYDLYNVYPSNNLLDCTFRTYTYYDDYTDPAFNGFSYNNSFLPSAVPATANKGRVTGTRVRVMDPDNPTANNWLTSVFYYDNKGRLIQSQSQNICGGLDITSNQYFFQGELQKTIVRHQNPLAQSVPGASGPLTDITVETDYERNFGHDGSGNDLVWHVQQKINNGTPYDLAYYSYDHLDRLVAKQLNIGNTLNTYNVRGFLAATETAQPIGTNSKVFFDEHLYYDQGFASKLYNGNIAGSTWSGYHLFGGIDHTRAYGYSYDMLNRLTHAEFRQDAQTPPSAPVWSKTDYDYTASNISYDLNGNLLSMDQRGVITAPIDMDKLTYSYAPNSNQLVKVKDAVASANTVGLPDFKDSADLATEYQYDDNGNLVSDANKKITSMTYNYLDKPEKITVQNGGTVTYVYDAAGNRLQKKVKDLQNNTTVYDYIGNFVYKDNVLQYILNDEGRCRPVASAETQGQTKFVYDYFIKDHLGNVRSVVTAEPVSTEYMASHEIASANVEQLFFDNIPSVRSDKPGSTDPSDHKAALLSASDPNTRVGTSIMLRVMPGDRFNISADAHYEGDYEDGETVDGNSLVESLMGTLTGGINYDGIPLAELPENIRTVEQTIGNPELANQIQNLLEQNDDPEQPKAHLNYLVFNDEMQLVPEESGSVQVPPAAINGWAHIVPYGTTEIQGQVAITEPGYIVVYIDNQSIGKDVWFDNVHVEHYTSEVLEEDHYYPFGLTLSSDAGAGLTPNQYKYNDKELQTEFNLQYYDYGARMYNSQIGRWNGIDPLAEKYYNTSSYSYVMNNPIKFIDPNGKEVWINHKNQRLRYDGGKLYNNDGSAYTGKVKGYLKHVVNSLNKLSESKTGKEMIEELTQSSNIFDITKSSLSPDKKGNEFVSSDQQSAYANQYKTDPQLAKNYQVLQESGKLNGGSGGTIYWDANGSYLPTTEGVQNNPAINLGHELAHGYDANKGLLDNRVEQGVKRDEWQAVYRENMIRQDLQIPLRTNYIIRATEAGKVTGGAGTSMLTPDNKPIIPFWYKP